ncbi:MAG: hypothetical protein KAT11_01880 [Phycisphaerae bacterium]|nr:hypothetical protein [Phycisphaerae bacterium]
MSCRQQQSGLTLVELIVATTLTTLVAGSTVGILRSTAAARNRAQTQLALQQQARAAVLAIATALANADRYPDRDALFEGLDDWLGEMPADRIRFFTLSTRKVRWGQPESNLKECEFYLAQPPDKPFALLMRRTDPTRNETPDDGGVLECIAENVLGLNFAYHDGIGWCEDWPQDTNGWPLAVCIELAVLAETEPPKLWTISRVVSFPHRKAENQEQSEEE